MTGKPRILVTGGAGFIGSHTCKELAKNGFVPVTLDNLSTGTRGSVRFGPFYHGDVADVDRVRSVIRKEQPALVIHFAANAYVGESVEAPAKYYRNNIGGMVGLLDGCLAEGLKHVVFSSSCATYGIPDELPIRESAPQNPINPYGFTKLAGEQILKDYHRAYSIRYGILRYFNAAGADPDGDLGEFHNPETHLIPIALQTAFGQRPHMDILGADYDTEDGTCVRDFIHVSDLARAHVLASKRLIAGNESFEVNLGTGTPHSVRQVIDRVTAVTGRLVNTRTHAARPGDPPVLYADVEKAAALLGFRAKLTSLDEMIETAVPWFRREAAE